jgi:hypothetical protein
MQTVNDDTRVPPVWIIAPAIWLSFGGYGYWIATIKRRSAVEGVLFGLLLGPIGCVVEATRRERTTEEVEEERLRDQQAAEARADREEKLLAASQAEASRRRDEARLRAEEMRIRRAEKYNRFACWFDRTILKFGWLKALPEVAQPIVIGLSLVLPIVAVLIYLLRRR